MRVLGIVSVCMLLIFGCEFQNIEADKTNTNIQGPCDSKEAIDLYELIDTKVGFRNPKDSLYYSNVTVGLFYQGTGNDPCFMIGKELSYKNPISRLFRVVWEGPTGVTSDQKIARALIRFTDKAYQDDIDRALPEAKGIYPLEIKVKEDSNYVVLADNREYKTALLKGYSNELNEVKCAEVSLSKTTKFDALNIVLANDTSRSWSQRVFLKPAEIPADRKYFVVREKECATCPEPTPVLSSQTKLISAGAEAIIQVKGCRVTVDGQGPLEWWEQTAGGTKKLIQRYSYSARNERVFKPLVTTTYFVRCQGEWYCKPAPEANITIDVR